MVKLSRVGWGAAQGHMASLCGKTRKGQDSRFSDLQSYDQLTFPLVADICWVPTVCQAQRVHKTEFHRADIWRQGIKKTNAEQADEILSYVDEGDKGTGKVITRGG